MRNRYNQYFVLLTDIREDSIQKVLSHIIDKWHEAYKGNLVITYETEFIGQESESHLMKKDKKVIIVDDDSINLQVAGKVAQATSEISFKLPDERSETEKTCRI